uniref:Ribosomal RNA methyltransferase FtsJ domain-containing protein n=1 Tax=viral metagenome TaxID=1070528 RepID=A0A6C0IY69_9ZZZZ
MNNILKTHSLELNQNRFDLKNLELKLSKTINHQDYNLNIFNIVNKYKKYIDNVDKFLWDKIKLLVNDYESIYSKEISVSSYIPISRAYFKFWELLKKYHLINNNANLNTLCLAEGPGGFVEAIYNYRKKHSKFDTKCTCMTLISEDNFIPDWKKASFFFKCNKNINLFYGKDNTGDLYNPDNIKELFKKFKKNKIDLATADGGFDYSSNYQTQEQSSYKLIVCEIISALGCLKEGGNFVIKIFDIHTKFTLKIIYFLTKYFKKVLIDKPVTSRNLNSEKYLICLNFVGIEDVLLEKFLILIDKWNNYEKKKMYITDIFTFDIPNDFENLIYNYNIIYSKYNLSNIIKALTYIQIGLPYKHEKYLRQYQVLKSSYWCYIYDIGINFKLEELNSEIYIE